MSITSLLFCCDFNSARSAMAEGIVRNFYGEHLRVDSAGLSCDELVNGFAIAVMQELHIDIQNHEPKLFSKLNDTPFDLIITLTENANLAVQNLPWSQNAIVEHWDIPNPVKQDLPHSSQLDSFRKTRDILMKLILSRLPLPMREGDPDYTQYFGTD